MAEPEEFNGSPLLTKSQRRYLWERTHEDREDDRRQRARIRDRVQDIISDFHFLFRHLPPEERAAIFDDLADYAEWRAEEIEQMREHAPGDEAGELEVRGRVPVDQSDAAKAGEDLFHGVTGSLGFLYAGVGNTSDFEGMLEVAIAQAGRQEGDLLDVDVSIKYTREADRDDVLDRWADGELTPEEIGEAIELDPTLPFDRHLRDGDE